MAKRDVSVLIKARDEASRKFKKVGGSFSGMASTIKSSAGAIGAALTAGFAAKFVNDLATQADAVGKVSKRIGITAEQYQKLTFAARRAGASNETIEKSFRKMQSTIFDAQQGLTTATDALDALGITQEELIGKSPAEQFDIMASALNNVEDSTEKAALAQDVFGRSGTQLIPMLDDYKALGDEAERTGRIMSNEAVAAAESYKDSIEDLSTTMKATVANSGILEWLADIAKSIEEIVESGNSLRLILEAIEEIVTGEVKTQNTIFEATTKEDVADKRREVADAKKQRAAENERKARAAISREQRIAKATQEATQEITDKVTKSLKDQLAQQRLINAGKEKEAFIAQQVARAQDRAATAQKTLTTEQIASIRKAAAELFEARKKDAKDKAVDLTVDQFSRRAQQATVSRFLSFREGGATEVEQVAKKTQDNTKQTAENTGSILAAFENLVTQLTLGVDLSQPLRLGT
jgi:hypothetical protein